MSTIVPELALFARNLKRAREAAGLAQQQLAERANVARSHVSNLERGLVNPSLVTIADLANALGCRLVDLFVDDGPPPETIAQNAVRSIVTMLTDAGFIKTA